MSIAIVNQVIGNVGWKDIHLRHLGCNDRLAATLDLASPKEIIGLRDSDLPSLTEQDCLLFNESDQRALKGETVAQVHEHDNSLFLVTKKPLRDDKQQIAGVVYHCQTLNHSALDYSSRLKALAFKEQTPKPLFHLSRREQECLVHLLAVKPRQRY